MRHKEIILGVTASIAVYKACDILRRLQESGFNLTVVMTPEAKELISAQIFQSLSGNKVYSQMFHDVDYYQIEHISLAQKADLILIAPATANIIAKLACGICDDLLTCLTVASKAKILIAPAMNENMYNNRIVQENIRKLKQQGFVFLGPRRGKLACGKTGMGCLASVEDIVKAVKRHL